MKRLLAILAVLAGATGAEAAPPVVDLIAPRAGTVLEGGQEAVIAWSAASLPDHVEEWEAFLSLDGGRYYAVRITPHLDAGTRSFSWRVPNVAASQVRILIRIGDERAERAVEFPQTFKIVPGFVSFSYDTSQVATTEGGGEPALPAAPPIVEWVSGSRSGSSLVTERHHDRSAIRREFSRRDDNNLAGAFAPGSHSLDPPEWISTANAGTPEVRGVPSLRKPRPVLLLVSRLNI